MSENPNAIRIHEADSVVTLTHPVKSGEKIVYLDAGRVRTVTAVSDIPLFHKAAIKALEAGAQVIKYGETIARATCRIEEGAHVHTQNISSPSR